MNASNENQQNKRINYYSPNRGFKINLWIVLLLLISLSAIAQAEKNYQAYLVHEDRVKPGMVDEYEQVAKDLVAACTEHNIQDLNWLTVSQADHTYLYLTPMEKFAELDANSFSGLSEKMGEDKMNALFDRFNPCYDEHGDYVIYLQKNLSYQPSGINTNPEGKYYRKFMYDYVTPSNQKAYLEGLKAIKELFVKMNSKMNYRIYSTGFGIMGKYYLIVLEGEDPVKFETLAAENWEDIGEDLMPLVKKIQTSVFRSEEKTGWMRGDLSYIPKK